MKKLLEQKQTLDDVSELIRLMESEINGLRHIVYCYNLSYGEEIKIKFFDNHENISYQMILNENGPKCHEIDSNITKIKNNYQIIKELINKLS